MRMRILLASVLFATLALSTGCASSPAERDNPGAATPAVGSLDTSPSPLALVADGFSPNTPRVAYGFVLRNPNADAVAVEPRVRITMRDASGAEIGSEEVTVPRVMPGGTMAWGREDADPHGKAVANVQFEMLAVGDWRAADEIVAGGYESPAVSDAKVETRGITTSFTGKIENPNGVAFKNVLVNLVLKNASG
ncbi:MAG TPA: hypothetical protein VF902_06565, partial [Coriobacteriia bacterium]